MTRIIAGVAGSLVLAVPGAGTRPTSDRVRESLFGALEAADVLDGATVLDLYAGSGALGLEAISRGAVVADLVEKSAAAAAVTERNARAIARAVPGATVHVHRSSADGFLRGAGRTYDVIFVDPPYDVDEDELGATLAAAAGVASDDALIVVERAARSPESHSPEGFETRRSKRYGDTVLWWLGRR